MFQAIAMNVFYAEEAKREEAQEAAQQQEVVVVKSAANDKDYKNENVA
jgi:hypothetical protein